MQTKSLHSIRIITATLASIYFIFYAFTYKDWHFIDSLNLIFHEAGHSIFMFFGQFVNVLGGSFFQVFLPFVFVIYFFLRSEKFSASLLLFWVGQNILNVSVYASDAVAMQLPLLGGDSSIHDWNWILDTMGLLKYTQTIGNGIFALGIIVIFLAIYFSFMNVESDNIKKT